MPSRPVVRRVLFVGALLGAAALTLAAVALHELLPPPLAGQRPALMYLLCLLYGAGLGAITGLSVAYTWARRARTAGVVCFLGGSGVMALACGTVWWMAASAGLALLKIVVSMAVWFAATTLWSLALILCGLGMVIAGRK